MSAYEQGQKARRWQMPRCATGFETESDADEWLEGWDAADAELLTPYDENSTSKYSALE